MAGNINPANAVTASRFLTLPPFVWAVDHGYQQYATLFLIVCGVLDLFDGAVARAFKCQTPFGEMFDAIADALCYGFAMIVVTAYGWVPWPPVVIIVALGAINMVLRAVYAKRAGRTTNYQSHAMERLVAYAAYLGAFGTNNYQPTYFFWVFAALMTVVMIHDTKRMAFDPIPGAAAAPTGPALEAAS
ncbi:MAG: CDP-alcohol phosphatidyltransferase family protein [Myxococcales bacterium]|nr:CDP-alcohol phosphatidyltransferase family protein [Myxococcales bacterium]